MGMGHPLWGSLHGAAIAFLIWETQPGLTGGKREKILGRNVF